MQEKLLLLRRRKGLSINETAGLLGINSKTYSLKERGVYEFTQDEMFALSNIFQENIDQIFLPRSHQIGAPGNRE